MLNFPNTPTENQLHQDPITLTWYRFHGEGWKEYDPPSLASLSDVSAITPNIGDKLIYDGEKWVPQFKELSFSSLTDVVGTSVINGYMVYDGENWVIQQSGTSPALAKLATSDGSSMSRYVWEYLTFQTVIYNNSNMIDVGAMDRITINEAGLYTINTSLLLNQTNVLLTTGTGGIEYTLRLTIFPAGEASYYIEDYHAEWTHQKDGAFLLQATRTLNMNVGDYIRASFYFQVDDDVQNMNSHMTAYKVSEII